MYVRRRSLCFDNNFTGKCFFHLKAFIFMHRYATAANANNLGYKLDSFPQFFIWIDGYDADGGS